MVKRHDTFQMFIEQLDPSIWSGDYSKEIRAVFKYSTLLVGFYDGKKNLTRSSLFLLFFSRVVETRVGY